MHFDRQIQKKIINLQIILWFYLVFFNNKNKLKERCLNQ